MNSFELMLDGSMLDGVIQMIVTPETYLGAGTVLAVRRLFLIGFKLATVLASLGMIVSFAIKHPRVSAGVCLAIICMIALPGCATIGKLPKDESTEYVRQVSIYGGDFCEEHRADMIELRRALVECYEIDYKTAACERMVDKYKTASWRYRSCRGHHLDNHILTNPANLYRR